MSKYDPLSTHLISLGRGRDHRLAFDRIEALLDSPLPPSAKRHQAWWANQRGSGHVQAHAWLEAGFHTCDLDLKGRQVTFKPVALPRAPTRLPQSQGDRPMTIAQAKRAVAMYLGVKPENVEITVRG